MNTVNVHKPPVLVESSITKAQQFGNDVQTGMKHPVEKYQPKKMIRHLTVAETKQNEFYHTIRAKRSTGSMPDCTIK